MSEAPLTEYETTMLKLFRETYDSCADEMQVARWIELHPQVCRALIEALTAVIIQVESDMY